MAVAAAAAGIAVEWAAAVVRYVHLSCKVECEVVVVVDDAVEIAVVAVDVVVVDVATGVVVRVAELVVV